MVLKNIINLFKHILETPETFTERIPPAILINGRKRTSTLHRGVKFFELEQSETMTPFLTRLFHKKRDYTRKMLITEILKINKISSINN